MKNVLLNFSLTIIFSILVASCTTIRQGEVGVKRKFGKLDNNVKFSGLHSYNPFTTIIIKVPTRIINLPLAVENTPSKEGLNISAEMAVLYRILPESAPKVLNTIGEKYEDVVIVSIFRSAAADVCARFFAKDMYTGQREVIEKEIAAEMHAILEPRGIIIESVLLKTIKLPAGLENSIEQKLEAEQETQRTQFVLQKKRLESEQEVQRMEYVLQKEHKEAERKIIEAKGIADAQKLISEGFNGITKQYIELKSIEAFKDLSVSPNTKIIITDGKTPLMVTPHAKE